MNRPTKALLVFAAFVWAGVLLGPALHAAPASKQAASRPKKAPAASAPTADQIRMVEEAAPSEARAKPQTPRKLLVFNLCKGFPHSSIPLAAKTMEIMGRKTGAYEAVLSDDMLMFQPENLKAFDAVLMNNTTGEVFLPKNLKDLTPDEQEAAKRLDAALKASFLEFVRSGKGLVGIHAATDCFYQWPDYGEMMGAYFNVHPWNEEVGVKIDDPSHPLNAAFGGMGFMIADEIYQFKDPYSREKLRVLLSLDTTKTDMNKGEKIRRTDGDFAVSWVHSYGQGRVFFCSFGHRNEIFTNPKILRHMLDGIQFALGDMPADTTPSAQLKLQEAPAAQDPPANSDPPSKPKQAAASEPVAAEMSLDDAWKEAPKYQFGQSRLCLTVIEQHVLQTAPSARERTEAVKRLLALLSSDATTECKEFACRQLAIIGSDKAVPALSALLLNKDLAEMGRYALERIPGPAADEALRSALATTGGKTKAGVINSIAQRKDSKALAALIESVGDPDPVVAEAAIAALGAIGGPEALKALSQAKSQVPAALGAEVSEAQLMCAEQLRAQGKTDEAAALYKELFAQGEPRPIRLAAAGGMVAAGGAKEASLAIDFLSSNDRDLQAIAARFVRDAQGKVDIQAFAAQLPNLSPAGQEMLLAALADRGDPAARPAAIEAAKSQDQTVRLAALRALAQLGDSSTAELLAQTASSAQGAEQEAARESLVRLKGADVDPAILAGLESAEPLIRAELIRALAGRRTPNAVPALLKSAKDADNSVRLESLKALGVLAEPQHTASLIDLLTAAKDGGEQKEAANAVVSVCRKIPEADKRAGAALAALASAKEPGIKSSLLSVLGRLGGSKALAAVRAALNDESAEAKSAAVRALADWPDAEPMNDLLEIARNAAAETHRVLALRGYVRMAGLPSNRPPEKTLAIYEQAMALAPRNDEKKMVLAGVANVKRPEALAMVAPYLDDESLQSEAAAAAVKIASSVKGLPKADVTAAMEKAVKIIKDKRLLKEAQALLEAAQEQGAKAQAGEKAPEGAKAAKREGKEAPKGAKSAKREAKKGEAGPAKPNPDNPEPKAVSKIPKLKS